MTLIVKAVVFPATWKTYISSAKMRVLKPKIDEIGKKYPKQEDAMKKQQEVMGLYSNMESVQWGMFADADSIPYFNGIVHVCAKRH